MIKMAANWLLSLLTYLTISINIQLSFSQDGDPTSLIYSNSFALELISTRENITDFTKQYGFHLSSKHNHFNAYRLVHPEIPVLSKRKAHRFLERLEQDDRVKYILQLEQLLRHKKGSAIYSSEELSMGNSTLYDIHHKQTKDINRIPNFTDPYFTDQWYLNNFGEIKQDFPLNLNVIPLWEKNITGKGVRICILDDGIDYTHPDISRNYDAAASTNLNGDFGNSDPMPNYTNPGNSHGTHCAGIVAAEANNGVCGVGLAYDARIGGIRMLDGIITDLLEAEALLFNPNYIDIYSASWGPVDDGTRMEGPGKYTKLALQKGVQQGRNGLGAIYIWATGNGGARYDDCNADGYVGSIETVAVGSISDKGLKPNFMEECPSMFVVIPTGQGLSNPLKRKMKERRQIVTTGLHGSCVRNFTGTSAAAPLAAGCMALVLQANPFLTWRDVQHIVVHGARIPSVDNSWFQNGAGIHFSNTFGFGIMDCAHMVKLAQSWKNVPVATKYSHFSRVMKRKISYMEPIYMKISTNEYDGSLKMNFLEHVQLYIKLKHSCRGELQIFLVSPCGTKSKMLSPRRLDCSKDGIDFNFLSVLHWGEDPNGTWTLQIFDKQDNENNGILIKWGLILHGYIKARKSNSSSTRKLTLEEVKLIIKRENLFAVSVNLTFPELKMKHNPKSIKKIDNDRHIINNKSSHLLVPHLQRNFRNLYVSLKLNNNFIKSPQNLNNSGYVRKRFFLWGSSKHNLAEGNIPPHPKPIHLHSFSKDITKTYPRLTNFTSCKYTLHNLGRSKKCKHINENISNKLKLLSVLVDFKNSQQIQSKMKISHLGNDSKSSNITTIKNHDKDKFRNSVKTSFMPQNYFVKYRQVGRFVAERMLHAGIPKETASLQNKPTTVTINSKLAEQNVLVNIIKKRLQLLIPVENHKYRTSLKNSRIGKNLKDFIMDNTKVSDSNSKITKYFSLNRFPIKKETTFEGELEVLQMKQNGTLEL